MTPRVTVLMPVYNTASYLREAVDSILNQTFTDFEFLIIDDASTDGSIDIIKSYNDPRISFTEKPENTGYTNSLNMGLEMARGEYIARMDSDDISLPERLEKQVAFMDANLEVGLCGTASLSFGYQNNVNKVVSGHNHLKAKLFFGNHFCHPSIVFRKTVLEKNDLKYDLQFEPAEDYAFWIKLARITKVDNLTDILINYRTHTNQISLKKENRQFELANFLKIKQVEELGIIYTLEEAAMHLSLLKDNLPATADNLQKAYNWINKLYQYNTKKNLFEQKLFESFLHDKWIKLICNIVSYNHSLLYLMFSSRLPFFSLLTVKEKITFLPKCLLQWKTRI